MKSTIIYPSVSGWVTPRTMEARLTTENCQIVLNQKISQINKIVVNAESINIPSITYMDPDVGRNITVLNVKFSQLKFNGEKYSRNRD